MHLLGVLCFEKSKIFFHRRLSTYRPSLQHLPSAEKTVHFITSFYQGPVPCCGRSSAFLPAACEQSNRSNVKPTKMQLSVVENTTSINSEFPSWSKYSKIGARSFGSFLSNRHLPHHEASYRHTIFDTSPKRSPAKGASAQCRPL